MNKSLLLIICLSCFSFSLFAQNDKNWEVNLNYAYQFDLNKSNEKLINNTQNLHQYGVSVKRLLVDKHHFQFLGGIGYSRQQILGSVGVNHCYGNDGPCLMYYLTTPNYRIELAEIPFVFRFPITDKFGIDITAIPQFRFYQNDNYDLEPKFLFDMNSIEIYSAVSYTFQHIRLSLGGRLMNWQMPDKLFYYDYDFLRENPNFYEQALYRYNPLKLAFSVSYAF
jgi:hypothetical protein